MDALHSQLLGELGDLQDTLQTTRNQTSILMESTGKEQCCCFFVLVCNINHVAVTGRKSTLNGLIRLVIIISRMLY